MIFGVDYSISLPAICLLDESHSFGNSSFFFLSAVKKAVWSTKIIKSELHKDWVTQQERFDHISNSAVGFIQSHRSGDPSKDVVYIEDYALGAKGKVFNIAEATGLFKHKIHRLGIPTVAVPPTVIKKFATGKGNAKKDQMFDALLKEQPDLNQHLAYWLSFKSNCDSPISDLVDSYWIARYAVRST